MGDDGADPSTVIETPDDLDISIPTRRRRASDDEGEDEFHDAAEGSILNVCFQSCNLCDLSPIFPGDDGGEGNAEKVINDSGNDADQIDAGSRPDPSPDKRATWGDEEEDESEEENATGEAKEEEDDEEAETKTKSKTGRGEPFEVPMQGQFWGHDDRFDEAEAAAHEE